MSVMAKIKHAINAVIRRGYWFNNVEFADCRKFKTYNTFNTQVVNLGSTSALHAFDYEGLNIKGANWALGHNPLAGDFAILRNYCSFLDSKGCTIIIPLCPFSSLSGSYEPFEDRYYSILYPSTIPSYSYVHDVQVQEKWQNPIWRYPIWGWILDFVHLFPNRKKSCLQEEQMESSAKQWINGWFHEFSLKDFTTPLSLVNQYSIQEAASIISNMIEFCKTHNIRVIITIPPMYHTLAEKFTPEGREKIIDSLFKQIKNKDYEFINYMDNPLFCNDRTLFEDSFLLNSKGAKVFTRQILTDLHVI